MSEQTSPIDPNVTELIVHYLDQSIDEHGLIKLQRALNEDPEVVQYFRIACMAAGNIAIGLKADESFAFDVFSQSTRSRMKLWGAAVTIAVAIVLAFSIWFMVSHESRTSIRDQVDTASATSAVAMLSDISDDAVFADSGESIKLGDSLPIGRIDLISGSAQLMFRSTAVVDLTGPCDFEMAGPNRGHLISGMLEAYVPERAHGFTIDLPGGARIVDLGTSFRVQVDHTAQYRISVLKGRVKWVRAEGSQIIKAGQIVRADGPSITNLVELGPLRKTVEVGPFREGGFDFGFAWPPDNPHGFIGVDESSRAWVEIAKNPRVRLFSDDRLITPQSPPSYAQFMGDQAGGAGMMQAVATRPGVEYELVAYLARAGGRVVPSIEIDVHDGPVQELSTGDLYHERIAIDWPVKTWRPHRVRFTAASDITSLCFTEPVDSSTLGSEPLIDSIQLTALTSHGDEASGNTIKPTSSSKGDDR